MPLLGELHTSFSLFISLLVKGTFHQTNCHNGLKHTLGDILTQDASFGLHSKRKTTTATATVKSTCQQNSQSLVYVSSHMQAVKQRHAHAKLKDDNRRTHWPNRSPKKKAGIAQQQKQWPGAEGSCMCGLTMKLSY